MTTATMTSPNTPDSRPNDGYPELRDTVALTFHLVATESHQNLFLADTRGVDLFYDLFLPNIPPEARQHYNCHSCRKFIQRYGNLVVIQEDGRLTSVMWDRDRCPPFFRNAIHAMQTHVELNNRAIGVFCTRDEVWGNPSTGEWSHFSVTPNKRWVYRGHQNPTKVMAEKREEMAILSRGVHKYPESAFRSALNILGANALYRGQRFVGVAKWWLRIHEIKKNRNLLWRESARAPVGFSHLGSTMIGTLLDDIVAGYSMGEIKRRFDSKMNPTQYQRPQSFPKDGAIEQAERLVEEMGVQRSLSRRFATMADIQTIWTPVHAPLPEKEKGVFGYLKDRGHEFKDKLVPHAGKISWDKFRREVLPEVTSMEYLTILSPTSYVGLVTATHEDAPPIIQWDKEGARNPVSWYVYNMGSAPSTWNLKGNTYTNVMGICLMPHMWYGNVSPVHHKGFILLLEGARDMTPRVGSSLFPEILKSSLHGVRSVIETHSNITYLDSSEGSVAGIVFSENRNWIANVRVTTELGRRDYSIDRYD